MGKLFNALASLALATLLALGGFVGYLFATDTLNPDRIEQLAGVIRGDYDNLPTTQPAVANSAPSDSDNRPASTGRSAEEAHARRQHEYLDELAVERAQADVEAQLRMLDQVMQRVVQNQEQLEAKQAEFEKQKEVRREAILDEGFQAELETVAGLKPAQAKEHIVRVWRRSKPDAVRLMVNLDVRQRKRILEQMRTNEELEIQTDLLEQIRVFGTEGNADTSGMTTGAAAP